MKKSIALLALAFGVSGAYAQDLTSKKGEPILPEEGDWSIAIDANPFFEYAKTFIGTSNGVNTPTWNFLTNPGVITGRYMKDATTAYRGSLRIGFGGNTQKMMNADRSVVASTVTTGFPEQAAMKENTWKTSNTTIGLAGGMEMRKGKTRLQGYYGGEVGLYVSMSKQKFTYGNTLVPVATAPAVVVDVTGADDFGTGANNVVSAASLGIQGAPGDARALERKNGTTFGFGLRGFIGAEYFIFPKMSVGGEFGWGLGISSTGASETKWESIGNNLVAPPANSDTVGQTTIKGNKSSQWGLDTDGKNSVWGPAGTLRFNLYF